MPWLMLRQWLTPAPKRLLIAPQDIRTADPTIADDIYAGHFSFSGRMVNAHGASPFEIEPPSVGWARMLYGFGWLRHLRAADTALAKANAQALVDDFIRRARPGEAVAFEPRVLARRLLSWLSQSPIILENGERAFYNRFMRSFAQSKARLQRLFASRLDDDARLLASIALASYSLCAQVSPRAQKRATRRLAKELSIQIFLDGGHVSRNPRLLLDLLLDLLPLRQAYAARSILAPPELLNSIDRMMPMLRLFRHGDGTLALFNGMGVTSAGTVAAILAYDDAKAQPLINARQSGYQRLEAGVGLVIADTGAPPPPLFSREAHAGCLAFEFSCADQRIVVNCGAPDNARVEARILTRATAAHSTLVVSDTSSSRLARFTGLESLAAGQIISGPNRVTVSRGVDEGGFYLEAGHDGYVALFDLVHSRRLTLAPDGSRLSGQDRLLRAGTSAKTMAQSYTLRFHLHPNVTVSEESTPAGVALVLANGERWRFEAGGLAISIEDSVFFAAANGARACQQLVLQGFAGAEVQVDWTFARIV